MRGQNARCGSLSPTIPKALPWAEGKRPVGPPPTSPDFSVDRLWDSRGLCTALDLGNLRRAPLACRHYGEIIEELGGEIETVVPDERVHFDAKSTKELLVSQGSKDWPAVPEDPPSPSCRR